MGKKLPGWRELPIGSVIVEPGSTAKLSLHTWRTFRPVIDQEKCIRCSFCWLYCPDGAVTEVKKPYITKQGKKYEVTYEVNYQYCKGCGICANECPVKAITMVEEVR